MKNPRPNRLLSRFLAGILLCLGLLTSISGNKATAQTYLVIDKPGKTKNFKLEPGATLEYKLKGQSSFTRGTISRLKDSTIIMNEGQQISLSDIEVIRKELDMMRIMSGFTFLGGVGYLTIDVVNNLINNIGPVFNQQTMLISGSLVASAILFKVFSYRKLRVGDPWRVKIIDMNNLPDINSTNGNH